MELGQISCDNLGMTRDTNISALSKGQDGITNYAFENHNIRILAVNDNTKFTVTNEKDTEYKGQIKGIFLGGCVLNSYLTLFIKDPNIISPKPDYIYRLEYTGNTVVITELYNGNLNFQFDHPIEAMGYYESAEVQKVYWLDGLNQNRFINIVAELKYYYYVTGDTTEYYYKDNKNILLSDGTLYAICLKNSTEVYYSNGLGVGSSVWTATDVAAFMAGGGTTIAALTVVYPPTLSISYKVNQYNDYSFDFQGRISAIPSATIEKNYNKAGTFQAGTIQYFFTYYNKYGIETCITWNSDLQYLSHTDRGGKPDEAISCGFDFNITNIDTKYDYLRIYASYRSGLNGVVNTRILVDISLEDRDTNDVITFTDFGSDGIQFNSDDLYYVGGQKIIANTLDYKQDTLFLGDITIPNAALAIDFPKYPVAIEDLKDASNSTVSILEGMHKYYDTGLGVYKYNPFLQWAYKYVSPIAEDGVVYQYNPEIAQSQEEVAGFKWREVYRFGIQFMNHEGEWTSAYWLGDKYCDYPPRSFTIADTIDVPADPNVPGSVDIYYPIDRFGNVEKTDYYDAYDNLVVPTTDPDTGVKNWVRTDVTRLDYQKDGCYIAKIIVDINAIKNSVANNPNINFGDYIAYRLLVVESNITTRRIVEQGVINPTMFNYPDRYYNRPYTIPSWLFRPRNSKITNRHYDTLPVQTETNAELQGIIKKQVPGFKPSTGGNYNSFIFIFASNEGSIWSGYLQYKLIYFNSGSTDMEKAERLYLRLYTGKCVDASDNEIPVPTSEIDKVATLIIKYGIWLKERDNDYPGDGIISFGQLLYDTGIISDPNVWSDSDIPAEGTANYTSLKSLIMSYLDKSKNGKAYTATHIYGDDYKIIASHWENHNTNKDKQGPLKTWDKIREWMADDLTDKMRATTSEEVGPELAGKIVMSNAMIPNSDQVKSIARAGSNAAEITLAIMAAIVAAAAVVISALSFGTLTAPMAMATAAAIGAATAALSCAAVGCASAAATLDIERQSMSDLCKEMLAMGYYPVGPASTGLSSRKHRSRYIGNLIDNFFIPKEYWGNSGLEGFNYWNVPQLKNELKWGYPFRTGHPYTEYACIGEDYNAFSLCGKLSGLDENEIDLKHKQNLFCVDEAIVTLNAPDVAETVNVVNNSLALKLDLVGMIPVDATYGMYKLQTENGLNSNSQVLQGRYRTNKIGNGAKSAIGMLNGDIYQDFKAEEANFDTPSMNLQVNETVDNYRVFMWNRGTSAGFAFPNASLTDGTGAAVVGYRSKIINKIFANMRYSTNTSYYKPFAIKIEKPVSCLDSDMTLKIMNFARDSKNYYESVDTISINDDYYPLIVGGNQYPGTDSRILNGGLKDPVSIKYRQTPHIIIPFEINKYNGGYNILPYLQTDNPLLPSDLYGAEAVEGVKIEGTVASIPIGNVYYYLPVNNCNNITTDNWNKDSTTTILTNDDILKLADLCIADTTNLPAGMASIESLVNGLTTPMLKTRADIISGAHTDKSMVSTTYLPTAIDSLLDKNKLYLFRPCKAVYYILRYDTGLSGWLSYKTTELLTNSKLIVPTLLSDQDPTLTSIYTTYSSNYLIDTIPVPAVYKWSIYPTNPNTDVDKSISEQHWNILSPTAEEVTTLGVYQPSTGDPSIYYPVIETQDEGSNTIYQIDFSSGVTIGNLEVDSLVRISKAGPMRIYSSSATEIKIDENNVIESTYTGVIQNDLTDNDILRCNKSIDVQQKDSAGNYNTVGTMYSFEIISNPNVVASKTYFVTKNTDPDNPQIVLLSDTLEDVLSNIQLEGTWNQDQLTWYADGSVPYLFLGELVKKEFDYDTWNGGNSELALQQLTWNVASHVTPLSDNITGTWGDTFYQRWECEKTYPYTEEDQNSNVEILSFMLETHHNIDGRCDVNRGINNLLNTRPSNTMFNDAYTQNDNFFTYQVLDSRFNKTRFEADVVWSLSKNNMDSIDRWTSLVATNEMSLDGRYGTVRKLLNVNDSLISFQDTGISGIKYNETAALNTTSGLPLQMGNTGKVDGYRMISDTIGCHNKFSLSKTSAGIFFADDLSKTFNQLAINGGVQDIGTKAEFSQWFKRNLNGELLNAYDENNFRASYDEITHDLYLVKSDPDICLVYNTSLGRFTSFMDYHHTPVITRMINTVGGTESIALRNVKQGALSKVEIHKMFAGPGYGSIYGQFRTYSMEYRLNPDPLHDSIFTNYVFTGDWTDPTKDVDSEHLFDTTARRYTTFDTVEAKDEYQYGIMNIPTSRMGSHPIKAKFRIWRGDIPRDGYTLQGIKLKGDRMRNPWIHLKFEKNKTDDSKMTFHNLTVTYYNQYGRI